jgi:hypothetical protein
MDKVTTLGLKLPDPITPPTSTLRRMRSHLLPRGSHRGAVCGRGKASSLVPDVPRSGLTPFRESRATAPKHLLRRAVGATPDRRSHAVCTCEILAGR